MNHLGRRQVGSFLHLSIATTDGSGVATTPDAKPTAKIYDSSGTLVDTVNLPVVDKSRLGTTYFAFPFRLDGDYSAGAYFVVYEWAVSATTYKDAASFEVVGGGDADGAVIGVSEFRTPAARHLLLQHDGGKLASGRNPT